MNCHICPYQSFLIILLCLSGYYIHSSVDKQRHKIAEPIKRYELRMDIERSSSAGGSVGPTVLFIGRLLLAVTEQLAYHLHPAKCTGLPIHLFIHSFSLPFFIRYFLLLFSLPFVLCFVYSLFISFLSSIHYFLISFILTEFIPFFFSFIN
jgi:hypothetical protein